MIVNGERETLEPRVAQVLVALAGRKGEVVSRDELVQRCWGGLAVSEDAINRSIAKLRQLAERLGGFEVETIPRVGYRLAEQGRPARSKTGRRLGRTPLIAAIILLVACAAAAVWCWRSASAVPQPTVAVLRFTSLNSGAESQHFAGSITAAVIDGLVQTGAQVPGSGAPLRTVEEARKSGAALIVSGTVRRQGPSIRVTTSVSSARNNSPIITRDFEAGAAETAALPDRVAASLASSIAWWIGFLPVEPDPATTEEILRISSLWFTDMMRAWELSHELAAKKPRSGAAQIVFASTTAYALADIPLHERASAVAAARDAAKRARMLLPGFGETVHTSECMLTPPGRLITTAECDRRMREAIRTDPEAPHLPLYFAEMLAHSGLLMEADQLTGRALAQSPLDRDRLYTRMFVLRVKVVGDRESNLPALEARTRRYWGPAAVAEARYRAAMVNGDVAEAESLVNDDVMGPAILPPEPLETARLVLRAVKTGSASDMASMRDRCSPPPPRWTPPYPDFGTCLVGFASVDDLDGFFTLADRGYRNVPRSDQEWLDGGGLYYPRHELFGRATAAARADRRLIEIARRTGLLAHWKNVRPPDFCFVERAPVCELVKPDLTGR